MGSAVCAEVCLIHVRHAGVHFGIHMEFFVGEGAGSSVIMGDKTHIHIHLHILCPERIGCPVGLCSIAGRLDIGIKIQDTNRQLSQNGSAGLDIVVGTGDRDGCRVGFLSDRVRCSEAFCQLHMIKLPVVYIVQVDHGGNGLDGLKLGCLQVQPVDGTKRNSVKSGICRNKFQGRSGTSGLNLNNTNNNRLVACVIADFKLNTVIAVCHGDAVDRNHTAREGGRNFNTVNVCLCGGSIQTGYIINSIWFLICVKQEIFICNCYRKVKNIACSYNNITLNKRSDAIKINLVKDRIFSVVNSFGIVYGKVIQIVCILTVD